MASTTAPSANVNPNEEKDQLMTGPLSVLMYSAKNNTRVLILLRNNRRLYGRVKAFDRHCNLVMEDVKEFWTEIPKGKGAAPVSRDRNIGKLFVRGDSVVIVVKNPGAMQE